MISFNDVGIGERFYFDGCDYIKTCNPQSGKTGAVHICTGTYRTDCENWIVVSPTQSTKEKEAKQNNEIAIFTHELDDIATDPTIIRITKEQKRIIEILYDYDILCPDINIKFKSDTFVCDATKE